MCYKRITHTLECDMRPLVVGSDDVTKPLVDPYATPSACHCAEQNPKIKPQFRCDYGHYCCFATAAKVPCRDAACEELVIFHRYVRRDPVYVDPAAADDDRAAASPDEGWAPLPVVDGDFCDLGLVPRASAEFARVRALFLEKARGKYAVMVEMKRIEADFRRVSVHLASRAHKLCLYLRGNGMEQPRHRHLRCYCEREYEDLYVEGKLLLGEYDAMFWAIEEYGARLRQLSNNREGIITGLDSWDDGDGWFPGRC
jgi:hypothetical protein